MPNFRANSPYSKIQPAYKTDAREKTWARLSYWVSLTYLASNCFFSAFIIRIGSAFIPFLLKNLCRLGFDLCGIQAAVIVAAIAHAMRATLSFFSVRTAPSYFAPFVIGITTRARITHLDKFTRHISTDKIPWQKVVQNIA